MGRIMDTVVEYFDIAGLYDTVEPDEDVLKSGLRGNKGAFLLRIFANEEGQTLFLLEPRRRSERALLNVIAESYVNGVSPRRVEHSSRVIHESTQCPSHTT